MPYEKEEDELSDVNWDRFAVRGYESRILGQLLYYCLNFYAEKINFRAYTSVCHFFHAEKINFYAEKINFRAEKKNVVPKKRIPCPGNKISMPWK